VAEVEISQFGSDLVTRFITDRTDTLIGACNPFPSPFPNPDPFPNPFPDPFPSPYPHPYPPFPFPCPILCVREGPPCDPPTPVNTPPFVHFITGADYTFVSLANSAEDLSRAFANAEGLFADDAILELEIIERFRQLNEAVFFQPSVAEEFAAAAVLSGLRNPTALEPQHARAAAKVCNVANSACSLAVLGLSVQPTPVVGFGAGFACGFSFGWNVADALWVD
jgi:hypothetical protein